MIRNRPIKLTGAKPIWHRCTLESLHTKVNDLHTKPYARHPAADPRGFPRRRRERPDGGAGGLLLLANFLSSGPPCASSPPSATASSPRLGLSLLAPASVRSVGARSSPCAGELVACPAPPHPRQQSPPRASASALTSLYRRR
jgi:hypothetical protein